MFAATVSVTGKPKVNSLSLPVIHLDSEADQVSPLVILNVGIRPEVADQTKRFHGLSPKW